MGDCWTPHVDGTQVLVVAHAPIHLPMLLSRPSRRTECRTKGLVRGTTIIQGSGAGKGLLTREGVPYIPLLTG